MKACLRDITKFFQKRNMIKFGRVASLPENEYGYDFAFSINFHKIVIVYVRLIINYNLLKVVFIWNLHGKTVCRV